MCGVHVLLFLSIIGIYINIISISRVIRHGFRLMYSEWHFQIETALKLSDPEIRKRFMKPNENAAHRFWTSRKVVIVARITRVLVRCRIKITSFVRVIFSIGITRPPSVPKQITICAVIKFVRNVGSLIASSVDQLNPAKRLRRSQTI